MGKEHVVTFTDDGFSPAELAVRAGDTVVFKNMGSHPFWPASAIHPTHEAYPGSNINLCGTATVAPIFDACRKLDPGASWSFVFNQAGNWKYHNHIAPGKRGAVTVTP